jgi:hypothetical protein
MLQKTLQAVTAAGNHVGTTQSAETSHWLDTGREGDMSSALPGCDRAVEKRHDQVDRHQHSQSPIGGGQVHPVGGDDPVCKQCECLAEASTHHGHARSVPIIDDTCAPSSAHVSSSPPPATSPSPLPSPLPRPP